MVTDAPLEDLEIIFLVRRCELIVRATKVAKCTRTRTSANMPDDDTRLVYFDRPGAAKGFSFNEVDGHGGVLLPGFVSLPLPNGSRLTCGRARTMMPRPAAGRARSTQPASRRLQGAARPKPRPSGAAAGWAAGEPGSALPYRFDTNIPRRHLTAREYLL